MNNIIKNCDFNRRLDPYLHNFQNIKKESVQRLFNVAFPFINLYKPAQKISSISLGIYQTGLMSSKLIENYKKGDWNAFRQNLGQLTLLVCSAAFNVLLPSVAILVSHGSQIVGSIYNIGVNLKKCQYQQAFEECKNIGYQAVYIAASLFATPEILLISLLAQASLELKNVKKEIEKGRFLEAFANLAMAFIRIRQAVPHAITLHRNEFGKQVTQENLNQILQEVEKQQALNGDQIVDFEKILIDQYYSSKIRNISFTKENGKLTNIFFNNISFHNCEFNGTRMAKSAFHNVKFVDSSLVFCDLTNVFIINSSFNNSSLFHLMAINSVLKNCKFTLCNIDNGFFLKSIFDHCSFSFCDLDSSDFAHSILMNTSFTNTKLDDSSFYKTVQKNTSFNYCSLEDSNFARSKLENVSFKDCGLSYASFYETFINSSKFVSSKLFETNFFNASVKKSKIIHSDLTDCLLIETKGEFTIRNSIPNRITRPIVGLNWSHEIGGAAYANLINKCVRNSNAIILKYDHDLENIDFNKLDEETKEALHKIANHGLDEASISISDEILKKAQKGSEIEKIRKKAEIISKYIHGIVIPGGSDIEPEFYGHKRSDSTFTESNYGRSLFELALISEAQSKGIPLQGICRGSQMVNVFNGGTLKQHVENQFGVTHNLTVNQNMDSKSADIIRQIIKGNSINGLSMHHQASDKIGKGLYVVMEENGVPKAIASEDGKVILTQFHPEISLYDGIYYPEGTFINNFSFFEYLAGQSKRYFDEKRIA